MDTFLICLVIIIVAFAIALFVWWLFKPKRESVVLIRPFKTRPNIIHKQGSGFGLDLGDRVVEEQDLAQQHAAAVREQIYQNEQAAARRAAEQNRQDEQSAYSTSYHRSEPSCHSSSDSGSSSSCDSGSSSSSSSSD